MKKTTEKYNGIKICKFISFIHNVKKYYLRIYCKVQPHHAEFTIEKT